jgi:hypothetical protein
MKIVKELDRSDYARSQHLAFSNDSFLIYGLGDDGNLYIKCSISGYHYPDWTRSDKISRGLPIGEMKKIIDAFGHLVIFT